jgi:hypothetical protein
MPGLVPGIHVFGRSKPEEDVDGRDKPGHDQSFKWLRDIRKVGGWRAGSPTHAPAMVMSPRL